jgi:hypothetical protein
MTGKTLALSMSLLLLVSTQVYAQTNQSGTAAPQGMTSGPAAGSPTSMRSPQAGPLETKHQRSVLREPRPKPIGAQHEFQGSSPAQR